MLNIRELERRWLKYKIKSYIPHTVILVTLLIITAVTVTFIDIENSPNKKKIPSKQKKEKTKKVTIEREKSKIKSNKREKETIKKEKEKKEKKTTLVKEEDNKRKLILKPSMNFIKKIENEDQQPYYKVLHKEKREKVVNTPPKEEYINIKQTHKENPQKNIKVEKPYKKQIITIERRNSQKDIKEIVKRFKKNNNPALSLFVAKKYYELGDYKQAYNYALITNGIDNDIEESWLIFAKSLVKLNRKKMAIKTLSEYIKYSHSGNAQILLNDIKSGKFQ